MGYEEFIYSALNRGKPYDQLPATLQGMITQEEYKVKVRDFWISKGSEWAGSPAQAACGEAEYYEHLVKSYKNWMRIFPYHLAEYVSRVMRVTPFKYYSDIMTAALVVERPYHQLPNFTAADAVRVLNIGRNEYIAMLNTCKGRRLLWRVNRTSVAREVLPTAPQDTKTEPWWKVNCVNLGDSEYRELGVDEMAVVKSAGQPGAQLHVGDLDAGLLNNLLRKGLVYLEVPVQAVDRFAIPPLEGFVSNKDAAQPLGASVVQGAADPLEALLYAVFVANSERLTVEELAGILNQPLKDVCNTLSMACRLGFATRMEPPTLPPPTTPIHQSNHPGDLLMPVDAEGNELGGQGSGVEASDDSQRLVAQLLKSRPSVSQLSGASGAGGDSRAVAVVLDAEATSFLMMGALSPGLKRHAVTLFEGGRVAGDATMTELTSELWASHAEGETFEGDMARLTQFAGALATVLDVARAVVGDTCTVELLRKESLAGLQPAAAAKVLATAYSGLVPVTPLPYPPLPLNMSQPIAPAYFGPTAHIMSPWTVLALYQTAGCGPLSLVICAGQRLSQLPEQLQGATHALIWCWDVESDGARAKASGLSGPVLDGSPSLVEAPMLLFTLNELLTRSALLVQPVHVPLTGLQCAPGQQEDVEEEEAPTHESEVLHMLGAVVDLPLPLTPDLAATSELASNLATLAASEGPQGQAHASGGDATVAVTGVLRRGPKHVSIQIPAAVLRAVHQLGLSHTVGVLRMIQLPGATPVATPTGAAPPKGTTQPLPPHGTVEEVTPLGGTWLPLSLHLGIPMYCLPLCKVVCAHAQADGFLLSEGRARQVQAQHTVHRALDDLMLQYAVAGLAAGTQQDQQDRRSGAGATDSTPTQASDRRAGVSYGIVQLPAVNLMFDGRVLRPVDLARCVQGPGVLRLL